jgi:hypothetical protein
MLYVTVMLNYYVALSQLPAESVMIPTLQPPPRSAWDCDSNNRSDLT